MPEKKKEEEPMREKGAGSEGAGRKELGWEGEELEVMS